MGKFPYPEGSIWRYWDLHLHGPEDLLNNQFEGADLAEKWDRWVEKVNLTTLEGIALTNYFCIDGYETLRGLWRAGKLPRVGCILANIEFRLGVNNKDDEPINAHVVFSDNVTPERIREFLTRLELVNTGEGSQRLFCTRDTIETVGFDKALVSEPALREALKNSFRKGDEYLLAVACNGYGSMRPGKGRKAVISEELDKWACMFFGKEENRSYYLKTDRYSKAVAKAVVCGSDAHSLDKIGTGGTWVKADPTFEGLRQIIFEPDDRISLAPQKPDSRPAYALISKVRFIDNTGKNLFAADYIKLNSKLNAIVGGKSTGKSLLMHYIASAVDPKEVEKRLAVDKREAYGIHKNPDFDFEVEWGDGLTQRLKQKKSASEMEPRRIVYIPQAFLNRLSEDEGSQDTLNEFVLSVLLQDPEALRAYTLHLDNIRQLEAEIGGIAERVNGLRRQEDDFKEQVKNLGDPVGIRKYIAELQTEIDRIRSQSGLSLEDTHLLEEKSHEEAEARKSIKEIENDLSVFRQLKQRTAIGFKQLTDQIDSSIGFASLAETKEMFDRFKTSLFEATLEIATDEADLEKALSAKSEKLEANLKAIDDILKPLNDRLKLGDEVRRKDSARKTEEEKVARIELLQKQSDSCRDQIKVGVHSLKEKVGEILDSYKVIQGEFKKYEARLIDISLNVHVHLDEKGFVSSCIDDCLSKNDLKRENPVLDAEGSYNFRQEDHTGIQFKMIESLVNGSIKTVKKKSISEAIQSVAKDRYTLDFSIAYKGDPLNKMSPGKKGLTLLRLLIELSDRDWPILLDQPEDDLDNRSVYIDLVSFIRRKKNERQIILVTHNPNLVVGADAELIIVSNQDGQEVGRDNKLHRFEYVAGAIENCFATPMAKGILNCMGIRNHVCDILEGGTEAFRKREAKYQ